MFFAPFDIIRCNNKNAIVIIFTHIFYGGKAKHSIMVKIDPILDTFFKVLISQKLLLLHIYFKNQVVLRAISFFHYFYNKDCVELCN